MLKRVLHFQEFDPASYRRGPDFTAMFFRYLFIAALFVLPTIAFLVGLLPTWFRWFMAGTAMLYFPPIMLLLVRKQSVTVTEDFKIILRNPKTVDSRVLVDAACSAVAYFALAGFALFALGR